MFEEPLIVEQRPYSVFVNRYQQKLYDFKPRPEERLTKVEREYQDLQRYRDTIVNLKLELEAAAKAGDRIAVIRLTEEIGFFEKGVKHLEERL